MNAPVSRTPISKAPIAGGSPGSADPAPLPPKLSPAGELARLAPLVAVVFLGFMAIGLTLPVLSVYVHDTLRLDPVAVGLVIGCQSVVTVLTRPMAGSLTDRRGARRAVLLGLPIAATAGLGYVASAFVASSAASLAVLLASRAVHGLAESLFATGAMTWAIGRIGPERTGKVMAWQGIAIYAGLGFGAPLGLWLMGSHGFVAAAAATAALPLAACLIALPVPGVKPRPHGPRLPLSRVIGLIWRFGIVLSLATAPFAMMAAFIAIHYAALGWAGGGFAMTGFGLGYIGVRLLFAHLPDRLGGARVAAVSLVIQCVGQILLWRAGDPTSALVGATISGIGFSLVFPSMGVEAVRRVPPESRGVAVGSFTAFFDVALAVTGPLAGFLVTPQGAAPVFLAGAILCVLAFVLVLTTPRPAGG